MSTLEDYMNELENAEYGAEAREPIINILMSVNNSLGEDAAEIEEYIDAIQNAVYGPDVLNAICSALRAISTVGGVGSSEEFWNITYPDASIPTYNGDWKDEGEDDSDE